MRLPCSPRLNQLYWVSSAVMEARTSSPLSRSGVGSTSWAERRMADQGTPHSSHWTICWRHALQRQAIPFDRESVLLVFESDEAPLPPTESHASCRISDARLDH